MNFIYPLVVPFRSVPLQNQLTISDRVQYVDTDDKEGKNLICESCCVLDETIQIDECSQNHVERNPQADPRVKLSETKRNEKTIELGPVAYFIYQSAKGKCKNKNKNTQDMQKH